MVPLCLRPIRFFLIALFLACVTSAGSVAPGVVNVTDGVQIHSTNTRVGNFTYGTEPGGRGTWGIIFSCTATFFFCVWTAVHPNIIPNLSPGLRTYYRTALMGIAAINPEAIVIVAFGQWRDARRLKHEWKMHFKDKKFPAKPGPNKASQKSNKKDPEPKPVESDWPELKMETAFFVVMGGFVIDESLNKSDKHSPSRHIEKLEKRPTHDKKPWLENRPFPTTFIATLTPRGFVKCLKEGYFDDMEYPAFNFNTIQDKGNTNRFAKFLSSLQVLWLFIQSLQRYISGLTLTLLEIHVLIQAACTILIFVCWWSKPLDVNEPIYLTLKKPKMDQEKHQSGNSQVDHGVDLHPIQNLDVDALLKLEVVEIGSYHGLRSRIPESRYYTISRTPTRGFAVGDRAFHDIIVYITGGTLHDEADEDKPDTLEKERDSPGIRRKASEISMMIFEAFFITVIAVLHALAWKSAAFPSNIERLLWQMSCIGMAGFPILIAIYTSNTTLSANIAKVLWHNHLAHYNCHQYYVQWTIYVYDVSEVIATGNYKDCETGKGKGKTDVEAREDCPRPKTPPHWLVIMHVIMAVVLMFLLVGYILCILYITVESYISLRRPPHDVFETPKWTDYWPHV